MPNIASVRILNALSVGSIDAAGLQTLLSTPASLGAFQGLLSSRATVSQMLASDAAWAAVSGSDTALQALTNTPASMQVLRRSPRLDALKLNKSRMAIAAATPYANRQIASQAVFAEYHRAGGFNSPIPSDIQTLSFGGGLYLAAGALGQLATSTDGLNWTARNSGVSTNTIVSSTFGTVDSAPLFIIGTLNGGSVSTSPDGITWTAIPTGMANVNVLYFGNGLFVAGSTTGQLVTSTDGINWTARAPGFGTQQIRGLTFGAGVFVAVGGNGGNTGIISTSPDGATWTTRTNPGIAAAPLHCVAFGAGFFSSGGQSGSLVTSTDGITWTARTSNVSGQISAITSSATIHVFAEGARVGTSTTGATWVRRGSGNYTGLNAAIFAGGAFLLGGSQGRVSRSTDGITFFSSASSGFGTANTARDGAFGNGTFVLVGTSGAIVTSTDGINWSQRHSAGTQEFLSVAFGNGQFVAGNSVGAIYTSPDGINWTFATTISAFAVNDLTFANNMFVAAMNTNQQLAWSLDGVSWTTVSAGAGTATTPIAVTGGAGVGFICVMADGTVCGSQNGINWSQKGSVLSAASVPALTYGAGTFVHINTQGIYTSADGTAWVRRLSASLSSVSFGNGVFTAAGNAGVFISADGVTWQNVVSKGNGTSSAFSASASSPTLQVIAGNGGLLLTSH